MKDNKSLQDFIDNLNEERSWRVHELSVLKASIPPRTDKNSALRIQEMLLRAGIALLYAHWEGFVKQAATHYLNFVSLRGLRHDELATPFLALCVKKQLNELALTNKYALQSAAIDYILAELPNRAYVPYKGIIDTKSNLKFWVFQDICVILGIDYRKYSLKANAIDKQLVDQRNGVAHGRELYFDFDEWESIYKIVLQLLEDFNSDLIESAVKNRYKKS